MGAELKQALEAEMRARAEHCLRQTHLHVNYYRVRRRIAFALPVRSFDVAPQIKAPWKEGAFWATWLGWAVEERLGCLGWAAEWFEDARAQAAAAQELSALAAWPKYRDDAQVPDLVLGHTARTMWTAHAKWRWVQPALRRELEAAFARIVEDVLPLSDRLHGGFKAVGDVLAVKQPSQYPYREIHNIQFIGTIGGALCAHALKHPAAEIFDQRLEALFLALLELRRRGFTEGVAYDGYLLDFITNWLEVLSPERHAAILNHPQFDEFAGESVKLGAPGEAVNVPELSDVEPRQMPFHISAHAKCLHLKPNAGAVWYLAQCRLDWLKAEALGALRPLADKLGGPEPVAGALDAHYALVLRSGWARDDLAVAMAASNCPMGHIHHDNGSLVVGTAGQWLLADPGYQQYLATSEREFALGVAAHNAPVIDGQAQSRKAAKRLCLETLSPELSHARLELAGCYDEKLGLESAVRGIWLLGKRLVVVADALHGRTRRSVTYHWHGHAEAAWWVEGRWFEICLDESVLALASPQVRLEDAAIARLRGSRGQETLTAPADPNAPVIWWVLSLERARPALSLEAHGRTLRVGAHVFSMD